MVRVGTRVGLLTVSGLHAIQLKKKAHLNRSPAVPDVPRKRRQFHDKHHLRASDAVSPVKRISIYFTFNVTFEKEGLEKKKIGRNVNWA